MQSKIAFVHLYNDYSGSPRVLSSIVQSFLEKKIGTRIISSSSEGFLSKLNGAEYSYVPYRFIPFKPAALALYLYCQVLFFFKVLFLPASYKTIYINTMHPFGAALAAIIRGNHVIFHVHETSIRPALLKKFLRRIIQFTANDIIYVSNFLKEKEDFPTKRTHVVYNALSTDFSKIQYHPKEIENFTVLMLCSLKKYKGVDDFIELSNHLPSIHFKLVLNTSQEELDSYFLHKHIPENLTLFSATQNVHPFYKQAHLVLNLSHPDAWIETFGMTIAEAFSYGIPAIVPEVGGITELVSQGQNGFLINHYKTDELCRVISSMSTQREFYESLSQKAKEKSEVFDHQHFTQQIQSILVA
jgi:glycosyltransferase involved in cell wall biosynthesis